MRHLALNLHSAMKTGCGVMDQYSQSRVLGPEDDAEEGELMV